MKYISIDIETTGLNPEEDQTLEIGFVVDDLTEPQPLGWGRVVLCHKKINGNPFALQLNSKLLREIHDNSRNLEEFADTDRSKEFSHNTLYVRPKSAIRHLRTMVTKTYDAYNWNLAGKNLASFDIPFMKNLDGFNLIRYHRRILDPSIFYMDIEDEVMPNLAECLDRAGMNPTNLHTAVGDAWDVCRLIRYASNLNTEVSPDFFAIKDLLSSC